MGLMLGSQIPFCELWLSASWRLGWVSRWGLRNVTNNTCFKTGMALHASNLMVLSIQVANSHVSQANSSDSSLELHGVRAGELGSGMWREDGLGRWLQETGGAGENPHTGRAVSGKRRRTQKWGAVQSRGRREKVGGPLRPACQLHRQNG